MKFSATIVAAAIAAAALTQSGVAQARTPAASPFMIADATTMTPAQRKHMMAMKAAMAKKKHTAMSSTNPSSNGGHQSTHATAMNAGNGSNVMQSNSSGSAMSTSKNPSANGGNQGSASSGTDAGANPGTVNTNPNTNLNTGTNPNGH